MIQHPNDHETRWSPCKEPWGLKTWDRRKMMVFNQNKMGKKEKNTWGLNPNQIEISEDGNYLRSWWNVGWNQKNRCQHAEIKPRNYGHVCSIWSGRNVTIVPMFPGGTLANILQIFLVVNFSWPTLRCSPATHKWDAEICKLLKSCAAGVVKAPLQSYLHLKHDNTCM